MRSFFMVDLSVVIVSFNTCELTCRCLESIFGNRWKSILEVILVDNNSVDDTVEVVKKKFPKVAVVENKENVGFARGNNLGVAKAHGEYVLLLNSDTEVYPRALDDLLDFAKKGKFDVASCKLVFPDGSFQHNGGYLPTFGPIFLWLSGMDDILDIFGVKTKIYHLRDEKQYKNLTELGWVAGTAMLIKRDVFDRVGLLDEKIFMYTEDVDFCFRVRLAGGRIGWNKDAVIMHVGGGSTKTPNLTQWLGEFRGLMYIYQKYYGVAASLVLRLMIYAFVLLRIVVFILLGRFNYSLTYGKIITAI